MASRIRLRREDGRVYLNRWGFECDRIGGVFLRKMEAPDPGLDLHDHPWSFVSLILKGGYVLCDLLGRAVRHTRPTLQDHDTRPSNTAQAVEFQVPRYGRVPQILSDGQVVIEIPQLSWEQRARLAEDKLLALTEGLDSEEAFRSLLVWNPLASAIVFMARRLEAEGLLR
jgi:hypothetical protein